MLLKTIVRWWTRFINHLTYWYLCVKRKQSVEPQNYTFSPEIQAESVHQVYTPLAFVSSVYSTKLLAQVSVFSLFLIGKSNEQYCRKKLANGVAAFTMTYARLFFWRKYLWLTGIASGSGSVWSGRWIGRFMALVELFAWRRVQYWGVVLNKSNVVIVNVDKPSACALQGRFNKEF